MSDRNPACLPREQVDTLDALFRQRVAHTPQLPAYREFDPDTQAWEESTWADMGREVARWQAALKQEGLAPGDRIAIMLPNCRAWVCMEQAALGLGLVVVPLFVNDRPESVAFILQDAGVRLLLCDGPEHWEQLAPIRSQLDGLARVISLELCGLTAQHPRLRCLEEWLPAEAGELQTVPKQPDDLATIVYTSGTTGRPKGVMLSHRNILANAYNGLATTSLASSDVFLSFLPLSHMLERTVGHYIPMIAGASVAYARSVTLLGEDLQTIRPTVLVSVPRIYERVYIRILTQLGEKSPFARNLFQRAVETGWQRFLHQQGRGAWSAALLSWPLLQRLVARKIMDKLGGRVRLAICGGAPLPPDVAKTFIGLGLNLLQGYGLTETSPVISVNRRASNIPASVGPALPGIEVKIGEADELLTRSECVMLGYWNNPEATAQIIDSEGWLHTGDKACIEDDHIFITGRLKEIIVLANGEKVPPADMEMAISQDPLFEQVLVIGEGRPYLTLIAVLNESAAQKLGIAKDSLNSEESEAIILEHAGAQLREFPGYAQVRRACLTFEPWTVENGLITPTLKLKRKRIIEEFGADIERLYEGH